MRKACLHGAELVVLPELFNIGCHLHSLPGASTDRDVNPHAHPYTETDPYAGRSRDSNP